MTLKKIDMSTITKAVKNCTTPTQKTIIEKIDISSNGFYPKSHSLNGFVITIVLLSYLILTILFFLSDCLHTIN